VVSGREKIWLEVCKTGIKQITQVITQPYHEMMCLKNNNNIISKSICQSMIEVALTGATHIE
jgi:hypothetical protein